MLVYHYVRSVVIICFRDFTFPCSYFKQFTFPRCSSSIFHPLFPFCSSCGSSPAKAELLAQTHTQNSTWHHLYLLTFSPYVFFHSGFDTQLPHVLQRSGPLFIKVSLLFVKRKTSSFLPLGNCKVENC